MWNLKKIKLIEAENRMVATCGDWEDLAKGTVLVDKNNRFWRLIIEHDDYS
jgi:hypothetical protein